MLSLVDLFSGLVTLFFLFFNYYFVNFFNNYFFILTTILFYFIFFLFYLPFILSRVDDRLLVLQPGVKAVPLRWESQVGGHWSTRDLPAPHNIKWVKFPRDLHLNAKIQLHSTTSKLQYWIPYAKELARQEHNATH